MRDHWLISYRKPFLYLSSTRENEPTYDVRFRGEDLWPNSAESALVHVGVFEGYLERAL